MKHEIIGNMLTVIVDKETYPSDVLYKCFYWYSDNYNVQIFPFDHFNYKVTLQCKVLEHNFDSILEKIQQDLIDFKLRDIVTKETRTIRELIIAKAFAYYDLADNPSTEISDPVGFNPDII